MVCKKNLFNHVFKPQSYSLASTRVIVVGLGFSISIRKRNLNKMRSFFFEQSHLKRFLFVCMDGRVWPFLSRQKKPAVVAVVHEIGCISLTFTGTTGAGEASRQTCIPKKTLPTLDTEGHLKKWAFLFLFLTKFQTETPWFNRIRSCCLNVSWINTGKAKGIKSPRDKAWRLQASRAPHKATRVTFSRQEQRR